MNTGFGLKSFISFVLSLHAALLLTGTLIEKFGVIELLSRITLKFREVSAAIWAAVLSLVPFRIDVNPDILSTYTLLTIPLIIHMFFKSEKPGRHPVLWYLAGLISVGMIIYGYDTWGYVVQLWVGTLKLIGAALPVSIVFTLVFLAITIIFIAVGGANGLVVAAILSPVITGVLLAAWAIASLSGYSVIDWLENGGLGTGWFGQAALAYVRLISLKGYGGMLLGLVTLFLLFLAPLTRAPVFLVSWTAMFFAADWFARVVQPQIEGWIDAL
jgi:hypothetical protein